MFILYLFAVIKITWAQLNPSGEETYILQHPRTWEGSINKPVTLTCEVYIPTSIISIGAQTQEIKWMWRSPGSISFSDVQQSSNRKNRVSIFTSNYNDIEKTKLSRLELERVQGDNAGEYKCVVGGGKTYGGAESEVALIRIVPDMMISPSVINMELNKPFSIRCNLSINPSLLYDAQDQRDQSSKPTLKWTVSTMLGVDPDDVTRMQTIYEDYSRDPASLPELKISVSENGRTLKVANATARHAGYYWCTFQSYSKSFTGQIKQRAIVRYGPRFQEDEFHQQNTTRTIKSFIGSTVDIYCNIVSLPFGVVQWYRKGNIPLKHNQQRYPLLPGKSDRYYYFLLDKYRNPTILRLNRVIYNDRDEYTCNVTGAGIRLSWSTLLKVKDKYSAFYPLGVILTQVALIFCLIFGAEKIYMPKNVHSHGHGHGHSHQHNHHHSHHDIQIRPNSAYGAPGFSSTLPVVRSNTGGFGNEPLANSGNCGGAGGYFDSSMPRHNTLSGIPSMQPISLLHRNDGVGMSPKQSPPITSLLFSSKGEI